MQKKYRIFYNVIVITNNNIDVSNQNSVNNMDVSILLRS